jgi:enterochelin esterase family protein
VWFSTGTDDYLLEITESTVKLLQQHGFEVEYQESTGGHTWTNWREYLHTFAQQLFD